MSINRAGAPYSHLNSEYAFCEAIKCCRGVIDLCRIVTQLPTRRNIEKTRSSILDEFMSKSDWFEHGGSETENGAIAVAKFFSWWATDNPTAGFWLCSRWYKDKVVPAFVAAMDDGEEDSITSTIRKLICTGYTPLFDLLNTPEITSRMTCAGTKNVLQLGRPESDTDKKLDEHTSLIASHSRALYFGLPLTCRSLEHDVEASERKITALQAELDQVKRERGAERAGEKLRANELTIAAQSGSIAALRYELEAMKKQQAAEKKQRTAEKKDLKNTKELLERLSKEMKALKRESGQRRGREEDDDDEVKVKKEVKDDSKKPPAAPKKTAPKNPAAKKPAPKKPAPKKAKK